MRALRRGQRRTAQPEKPLHSFPLGGGQVRWTALWWTVAKEAVANWSGHKDARQGAALAYYSVFSLGPDYLDRHRSSGGGRYWTGDVFSKRDAGGKRRAGEAIEARAHFQGGHEL
jgi:hypothetical protein